MYIEPHKARLGCSQQAQHLSVTCLGIIEPQPLRPVLPRGGVENRDESSLCRDESSLDRDGVSYKLGTSPKRDEVSINRDEHLPTSFFLPSTFNCIH
eukprot:TRINITY_DN14848_c0_g1_i1.p1 TRINITY_DN14848_c0_g1~~TRINITY_DN14848_c0_g1_i1.p1  ORF type:complete len:97 (-),score=9.74 TRINITY_DN14848_c0_g1_i1:122-412(-)